MPVSLLAFALRFATAPTEDRESIRDKHTDEIEALEQSFEEIADRLAEIASEFGDWEEEARELWETIAAEMEREAPRLVGGRRAAVGGTGRDGSVRVVGFPPGLLHPDGRLQRLA